MRSDLPKRSTKASKQVAAATRARSQPNCLRPRDGASVPRVICSGSRVVTSDQEIFEARCKLCGARDSDKLLSLEGHGDAGLR
jgi:hypothetical protein